MGAIWLHRLASRDALAPWRLGLEAASALGIWYVVGFWVEYGHTGLLLVPFFLLAMDQLHRKRHGELAERLEVTAASLLLLATAGLMNSSDIAKYFTLATALLVLLMATGAHRLISTVPFAMPRRLWLAWYPVHLAVIVLLL